MAYTEEELKKQLETKEYEYGFYTEIDSETFPVGLNEEIVKAISKKILLSVISLCHFDKIDMKPQLSLEKIVKKRQNTAKSSILSHFGKSWIWSKIPKFCHTFYLDAL